MRKLLCCSMLVLAVCVQASRANNKDDFSLKVHITAIEMQQGTRPLESETVLQYDHGTTTTVNKPAEGGGTYYWHLYTAKIDGDPVTYKLSTHGVVLRIGDYSAHWDKKGALEIQYTDAKGHVQHKPFFVRAATKDESSASKEGPQ
jgi:hypothetical protein